jgi:F0F1-type ATP synthase membrane subunit b/b'
VAEWRTVLSEIVNLAVMVPILYRFSFRSFVRALDERSKRVTSELDEAERRQREAYELWAKCGESEGRMEERRTSMQQEAEEELRRARKHVPAARVDEIRAMRHRALLAVNGAHPNASHGHRCQLGSLAVALTKRPIRKAGGTASGGLHAPPSRALCHFAGRRVSPCAAGRRVVTSKRGAPQRGQEGRCVRVTT